MCVADPLGVTSLSFRLPPFALNLHCFFPVFNFTSESSLSSQPGVTYRLILQTNCQLPPSSLLLVRFPYGFYDFDSQILKPQVRINENSLVYSASLKATHRDFLLGVENLKQYDDILFFQTGLAAAGRSALGLFGYENNALLIQLGYEFGVEAFDTLELAFDNVSNPEHQGRLVDFHLAAYFGSSVLFDLHNFGDLLFYESQSSGQGLVLTDVQLFPRNRNSVASYEFFFEIFSGIFESTKIIIEFNNQFSNLINGDAFNARFPDLQSPRQGTHSARVLLQAPGRLHQQQISARIHLRVQFF